VTVVSSEEGIRVCASVDLVDSGRGVRFPVASNGTGANGFAIRYRGEVRGFLNRCTHAYVELDWQRGRFFDRSGLYLMCATHGAVYSPDSGRCVGGPCSQGLRVIRVSERDGVVYWHPDDAIAPAVPAPAPL
jgi:nitrite reductase/ring-hydroxylating ferredoxin subunit